MRIEPYVYLVGSGQLGFDLTDPYDCNIYLFDAGDTHLFLTPARAWMLTKFCTSVGKMT